MTFNPGSQIDTSTVSRRGGGGGGRGGGIAVGGGAIVTIILFVVSQFLGIDLTGLAPQEGGGTSAGGGSDEQVTGCTGEDANDPANRDCRIAGASDSLDSYWTSVFQQNGIEYASPAVTLFDSAVDTGCGQATAAVGPFYCPPDQRIYVDTTFFDQLQSQFGAQGGNLAEMYVIAHEWGHHSQNLTGQLDNVQQGDTGPQSTQVRSELQADCYAGAWIAAASSQPDPGQSQPLLQPVTQEQLNEALDAAMVIGDDSIQEMGGGGVNPEGWTHGSGEQRQTWLMNGYTNGVGACDTWGAATV